MRVRDLALIDEYCRETRLHGKKTIINDFFDKNPDIHIKDVLDKLATLTDRVHCIFFYENWKKNLGPFDYLRLNGIRAKIYKQIVERGKKIFAGIIKKDRKGKTFDEIVIGKLIPLFIRNEHCILDEIMKHFHKLLDSSSSLKHAHSGLINSIIKIFHIIQFIKEQGGEEDVIKQTMTINANTLKGRARFVLYTIVSRDPYFSPYATFLKNLLTSVDYSEREFPRDMSEEQQRLLTELGQVKNIERFVEVADRIVLDCKGYVSKIYEAFELLLNEPLINIYKILKFTGCKQLFHTWIKNAPVAVQEFPQLEKKIALVQKELIEVGRSQPLPGNREELLALMYCQTIDFTDKYKLLHKSIGTFSDKELDTLIIACLHNIKNQQYQTERTMVTSTMQKLESVYTIEEIALLFQDEKNATDIKLRRFKKKFKENIKNISANVNFDIKKVFPEIAELVKKERLLPQSLLALLDRREEPGKPSKLTVNIINFLNNFYMVLNYRLILEFWYQYFKSLVHTDGIFLKKMLSLMTKEELYDIYITSASDEEKKITRFKSIIEYGTIEKEIREKILSSLMISQSEKDEFRIETYNILLEKYACSYTIIIKDDTGKLLLSKTKETIRCFLDFLESIKNHKIRTIVAINDRQLKLLYQKAHIDYIDSCIHYIKKKIALLTLQDPVSGYSEERVRDLLRNMKDQLFLKGFIGRCREEFYLRKEILFSLKSELRERGKKGEERLSRINREIKDQVMALRTLKAIFHTLRDLVQEKKVEIEENLLIIEEIPLPVLQEEENQEPPGADKTEEDNLKELQKVSTLNRDTIECALMNNRVNENIRIMNGLKERVKNKEGDALKEIHDLLAKLPELEELDIPDELFYSTFKSFNEAEACVRNSLATQKKEESCGYLQNLIDRCTAELNDRQDYVFRHEKQDDITVSIMYYEKEIEAQKERVELLHQFRGFLIDTLKKYERNRD